LAQWDDINFEKNAIRLWTSKRRGGNKEPRVIAMHPELREIIDKRLTKKIDCPFVFLIQKKMLVGLAILPS
jgi:integrase